MVDKTKFGATSMEPSADEELHQHHLALESQTEGDQEQGNATEEGKNAKWNFIPLIKPPSSILAANKKINNIAYLITWVVRWASHGL